MVHAPALMVGDQPVDGLGFKYPEAILLSSSVSAPGAAHDAREPARQGTEKPCLGRSSTLLGTGAKRRAQQDFSSLPRRLTADGSPNAN